MVYIDRSKLLSLIVSSKGGFFSVDFTKLDGTLRKMTCRLGVTSKLKGGINKVEALNNPYKVVYEPTKGEYRTINLNTVQSIRIRGKQYAIKN